MKTADFDFVLPDACIALEPPAERTAARLLQVGEALVDRQIADLPTILRPGDLLVVNDTKVIPAALEGERSPRQVDGEAVAVEANLIERLEPREGQAHWRSLARPGKRLKVGDPIDFRGLQATVTARDGMQTDLLFAVDDDRFEDALMRAGMPPLPPYIARRRAVREDDRERYQTVYAKTAGSVAAPTAGLHFTDALFTALQQRGIERASLTLHVGAGTFLPVTEDDTDKHEMHAEWGEVTADAAVQINEARARGGRIIAVGTTSLRLLESAWDGEKIAPFCGETSIFLKPGDAFPASDMLLTNFHLPRSTLFMLVCGYAGTERMKSAYAHAVEAGYRFYSYGDACLLERNAPC